MVREMTDELIVDHAMGRMADVLPLTARELRDRSKRLCVRGIFDESHMEPWNWSEEWKNVPCLMQQLYAECLGFSDPPDEKLYASLVKDAIKSSQVMQRMQIRTF